MVNIMEGQQMVKLHSTKEVMDGRLREQNTAKLETMFW